VRKYNTEICNQWREIQSGNEGWKEAEKWEIHQQKWLVMWRLVCRSEGASVMRPPRNQYILSGEQMQMRNRPLWKFYWEKSNLRRLLILWKVVIYSMLWYDCYTRNAFDMGLWKCISNQSSVKVWWLISIRNWSEDGEGAKAKRSNMKTRSLKL